MKIFSSKNQCKRQTGFTLIEVAIVLVIVGLLLGGIIKGASVQRDINKTAEEKAALANIKSTLLTFLTVNKYLPCPDTDNDGYEDRNPNPNGVFCTATEGQLPALTLGGVKARDSYGSYYIYSINTDADDTNLILRTCESASYFARTGVVNNTGCGTSPVFNLPATTPPYFQLNTHPIGATTVIGGNLIVCNESVTTCESGTPSSGRLAEFVPVVIASLGQNGLATNTNCNNAGAIEQENCDGDRYFHQYYAPTDTFDDRLIWISAYEIKQALINIGVDLSP